MNFVKIIFFIYFIILRPPKDGPIRAKWIQIVEEHSPKNSKNYLVCNLHFIRGQLKRQTAGGGLKLAPGVVPEVYESNNNSAENNAEPGQFMYGDAWGFHITFDST